MMKLLLAVCLLACCDLSFAQTNTNYPSAKTVLQKTSDQLASLKSVRYSYVREMKYYADNYHSKDSASMFIEFADQLIGGFRFQAKQTDSRFIYTGKQTLRINESKLTIDSAAVTSIKKLESNSFLFHSLVTLRNIIPKIIANDHFEKTISDTAIGGIKYYNIKLEGKGLYFAGLGDISGFTDSTLRRPYYLVVDKKSFLPVIFIAKIIHGSDDRDFITVTYRSMQQKPASVAAGSWDYASYRTRYKPFVPEVIIPVIKAGASVPDFTLPSYGLYGNDSISTTQLKGHVVLLEFWFKSCGPCLQAMPNYNALQQQYKDKGFKLVTVNVEDPKEDIAFFYKKFSPVYPMLYDGQALFKQLGFNGCPSSVLVDKNGKAVKTFYGYDETKIKASVDELLGE